jgi:hypothetical protein
MTVIAYIKTKDKIYLGSDSLASGSIEYLDFGGKMFKKPFKIKIGDTKSMNNIIVAYSGAVGVAEFLQYAFQFPKWNKKECISFKEYIASEFLPNFRLALLNAGLLNTNQGSQDSGLHFYIIYNNEIIEIQHNLTTFTSGLEYGAIGSGSIVCMGALDFSRNQVAKPKVRLRRCIETASRLSSSVGGKTQIHIITLEDYR